MDTTLTITTPTERPIRTYLGRVKSILLSPGRFFREDFPSFSLSDSLAFGLVSGWLAAGFAFALETLNSLLLVSLFERWVQKMFASEEGFSFLGLDGSSFIWSAGFLLVAPFFYLLRIFYGAAVLYVFARLFIDEEGEPVTYRSLAAIRACAFTGQWLAVVPIFGFFLAFVANVALLVAGIRERYRVSTRRAAVVVLAPYFLLAFAVFLLAVFFLLLLSQLPFQELMGLEA